jgi:tRNA(Ile2) C34 agmatinyltransferase TiaS
MKTNNPTPKCPRCGAHMDAGVAPGENGGTE